MSSLRSLFSLNTCQIVTLEEIMAKHGDGCGCKGCTAIQKMKAAAAKEKEAHTKGRHGNEEEIPPGSDYTIRKSWGRMERGKTS